MSNPLYTTHAYSKLLEYSPTLLQADIGELFNDPKRASQYNIEACGLFLDYSKQRLDNETRQALIELTESIKLPLMIRQLFEGEKINSSEHRAALHTALRQAEPSLISVFDKPDELAQIAVVHQKMRQIAERIQTKKMLGFTQKPIQHIIHIGIGGSELGPKMVLHALKPFSLPDIRIDFVSTLDAAQIQDTLATAQPETTLFIIASKTFSTRETLDNADIAKNWLLKSGAKAHELSQHFIAITQCADKAMNFGVDPQHILPIWDWVGGRFSVWSAIGLPIAISLGMDHFEAFLKGAQAMDEHFKTSAFANNMPVMLALLSFLATEFFNAKTEAILPYDYRLQFLVSYLQQLHMESNGKQTQHNDEPVNYATSPIIWGDIGTNGQHAFHQLLHQGTHTQSIDFIASVQASHSLEKQHEALLANLFAQSQTLYLGCTEAQAIEQLRKSGYSDKDALRLAPHLMMPGNRPHNILLLSKLDPYHLGALIALYEHKVFVLAALWNINPFDQWGVELGKKLATQLESTLNVEATKEKTPPSLLAALRFYHQKKKK